MSCSTSGVPFHEGGPTPLKISARWPDGSWGPPRAGGGCAQGSGGGLARPASASSLQEGMILIMARTCLVCSGPRRAEIDHELLSGTPLREIAGQFGTSKSSLDRHRSHIELIGGKHLAMGQVAAVAAETADPQKLIDKVHELLVNAQRLTRRAERAKNLQTAFQGIREVRGILELIGKLNGEIATGTRVAMGVKVGDQSARGAEVEDIKKKLWAKLANLQPVMSRPPQWRERFREYLDEIVADTRSPEGQAANKARIHELLTKAGYVHPNNMDLAELTDEQRALVEGLVEAARKKSAELVSGAVQ